MSEDAPVVRLVNVLLVDALRRGASDIHVEPYEKEMRIRFRIDGVLYDVMHPPLRLRDALISRIKIMSKLDISEKRLPQDGRIKIKLKHQGARASWTSASRRSPRSSARKSCCVCSTKRS